MFSKTLTISAIIFCFSLSAAFASDTVTIKKDITYAKTGKVSVTGDVYYPAAKEKLPGLVLVHGGGFVAGDKSWRSFIGVSQQLAEAGYVVFNINYRLINRGGTYPHSIADVNCAVRWIKAHADEYSMDKGKVGIIGSSAGGYLVLMAGLTSGGEYELADCPAKAEDSTVSAIVDYFGIADWPTFIEFDSKSRDLAKLFLNKKTIEQEPELYREASPTSHLKGAPPTLIHQGTSDPLVPFSQSKEIYEAMQKAGVDVRLESYEGSGHGFISDLDTPVGRRALCLSIAFFNEKLKGLPPAGANDCPLK